MSRYKHRISGEPFDEDRKIYGAWDLLEVASMFEFDRLEAAVADPELGHMAASLFGDVCRPLRNMFLRRRAEEYGCMDGPVRVTGRGLFWPIYVQSEVTVHPNPDVQEIARQWTKADASFIDELRKNVVQASPELHKLSAEVLLRMIHKSFCDTGYSSKEDVSLLMSHASFRYLCEEDKKFLERFRPETSLKVILDTGRIGTFNGTPIYGEFMRPARYQVLSPPGETYLLSRRLGIYAETEETHSDHKGVRLHQDVRMWLDFSGSYVHTS